MKKGIILTITALVMSVMIHAQEIKDGNGDILSTIDELGIIKDVNDQMIGKFMINGEVRDGNDDLLGKIEGNQFKDMNGDVLGSISASGEIFDINNMRIGDVSNQTMINDIDGQEILIASSSIDEKRLVAYLFFFFNM
jgi:hypothetical protein